MKRFLLLALAAACLVPAALAPSARAAVPCRDKIYNEWYSTGKISTDYPIACYHDALKHIPSDAQVYSNLGSDIKAALQAALAREKDPSGGAPGSVGSGPGSASHHRTTTTGDTKGALKTKLNDRAANAGLVAAPVAASDPGGSGLPLPIIVLGAVAILLAAAGAVGTGIRHFRRRSAS